MDVSWSRFRGFEDRNEIILMSIEAMEFVKIVEKIKENTASKFHEEFIERRFNPFNRFFTMFMPIFPETYKNQYEKALDLAREKRYTSIEDNTLISMENFLEAIGSKLSAVQSRDMELLTAMR